MIDSVCIVERNHLTLSASGREYGQLRLNLGRKIEVQPAQFAMIKPHGLVEPLLRRAMAFYRCETVDGGTHSEFIYQIIGRGTKALADLRRGDKVDFLGPLGNTFSEGNDEALLVAGGAGSPALYMLAEREKTRGRAVRLFIGGASKGDLCGLDDYVKLIGQESITATTLDGSHGSPGFVTSPLEKYLTRIQTNNAEILACGPEPMLDRVSEIASEYRIPTQLSLESPMACGFGICVGCAVAVKADVPEGFIYKRVCVDGPVFRSDELYSVKTMHAA